MFRLLILGLALVLLALPAVAASTGTSSARRGYECPPDVPDVCFCDGSFADCEYMARKECTGGKLDPENCGYIRNGKKTCFCGTQKNTRLPRKPRPGPTKLIKPNIQKVAPQ
jgi:hypothetical protein